jgi:hypothetical protein
MSSFFDKGTINVFRRSTCPHPILPGKHTLNPPIVTVIGAGVAGLTAAHELVERGFLVQVVEGTEDPFHPGRPIVGGMAANQPARVRGNIEDLHADLMRERLSPKTPAQRKKVITWLMWILALNRTRWIATEVPFPLPRVLLDSPEAQSAPELAKGLCAKLQQAKAAYQQRWVWDLVLRPVLMGALTAADPDESNAPAPQKVKEIFDAWKGAAAKDIALKLRHLMELGHHSGIKKHDPVTWPIDVPTEEEFTAYLEPVIEPAFEREFLCFRLVPRAVPGVEGAETRARELFDEWCKYIQANPSLKSCLLTDAPSGERWRTPEQKVRVIPAKEPIERDKGQFMTSWLQVEVIEQRIPGEHGYRFFPSSYRHLDDTMKRIPLFDEEGRATGFTVFDNLKPTVFQGLGITSADLRSYGVDPDVIDRKDDPPPPCAGKRHDARHSRVVEIYRNRAKSLEGLRNRTDRFIERLGGNPWDGILFGSKMFRYMSSCPERRRSQYEAKRWSDFVDVDRPEAQGGFSEAMRKQMQAAAQALLAFSVGEADARTYGDTAAQLFLDQMEDGSRTDRTLNGPTSAAWLEPWRDYLTRQGVRFFCAKVDKLVEESGELVPAFLRPDPRSADGESLPLKNGEPLLSEEGEPLLVYDEDSPETSPDFYVLALDLPAAAKLIQEVPASARSAEWNKLLELRQKATPVEGTVSLKDMTGIQFFFDAKTSLGRGHMYFPESRWGLSSISQTEFWLSRGGFSDGYLGVLSVDICTAGTPEEDGSFWHALQEGFNRGAFDVGTAKTSGSYRVAKETWEQIRIRIDRNDKLPDPKCFHVDANVMSGRNTTPYLAATPEVRDRPGRRGGDTCVGKEEIAYGVTHNRWVLCGTYMATHTRMTTMEAANESARHAVSRVLEIMGTDDHRRGQLSNAEIVSVVEDDPAVRDALLKFDALGNKRYNGAWGRRNFDPPDIWDPEDYELEDMDLLRRIDRRLLQLGLPHFFDILRVDERLHLAYQTAKMYEQDMKEVNVQNLLGLATSTADAVATKEYGRGYAKREADRREPFEKGLSDLVDKMKNDQGRFPDMKTLGLEQLDMLMKKLTKP